MKVEWGKSYLVEDLEVELVANDLSALAAVDGADREDVLHVLEEIDRGVGDDEGVVVERILVAIEVGTNLRKISRKE